MNRIKPEEVVAAYRVIGFAPIQRNFRCGAGCCGLTAVYQASTGRCYVGNSELIIWSNKIFGRQYVAGFIRGFDGGDDVLDCASSDGFQDGKAAWQSCVDAGLTKR